MSFTQGFLNFNEKVAVKTDNNICGQILDALSYAIKITPSPSFPGHTAKGLLANQYYTKIGGEFSTEVDSSTSATGEASVARLTAALATKPFYKRDNVLTFTNNVSYAYRAENVGWPKSENPHWVNNIGPYKMISTSMNYWKGKYT